MKKLLLIALFSASVHAQDQYAFVSAAIQPAAQPSVSAQIGAMYKNFEVGAELGSDPDMIRYAAFVNYALPLSKNYALVNGLSYGSIIRGDFNFLSLGYNAELRRDFGAFTAGVMLNVQQRNDIMHYFPDCDNRWQPIGLLKIQYKLN